MVCKTKIQTVGEGVISCNPKGTPEHFVQNPKSPLNKISQKISGFHLPSISFITRVDFNNKTHKNSKKIRGFLNH
jgi:hypothetical protein